MNLKDLLLGFGEWLHVGENRKKGKKFNQRSSLFEFQCWLAVIFLRSFFSLFSIEHWIYRRSRHSMLSTRDIVKLNRATAIAWSTVSWSFSVLLSLYVSSTWCCCASVPDDICRVSPVCSRSHRSQVATAQSEWRREWGRNYATVDFVVFLSLASLDLFSLRSMLSLAVLDRSIKNGVA